MSEGLLLRGLDGANPLAFLAALGTLRTLSLALPDEKVRMRWEQAEGAWRPSIYSSAGVDGDRVLTVLDQQLVRDRGQHPTRFIDYKSSNEEARAFFHAVRTGLPWPTGLDAWIASMANDVHPDATAPLQLTRSDYLPGNLDQVIANTTVAYLRKALLLPWMYDDRLSGQSLHLEPTEDRRHAYQWSQPSGDPARNSSGNVLGANRLAIEALPLFLGLPSSNPERLLMTGWTGVRADDSTWTWPIWSALVTIDVVRSLLAVGELQASTPSSLDLVPRGIVTAYRSRRILVEKTPNLTPSQCIL